jgi:hypothetical protein
MQEEFMLASRRRWQLLLFISVCLSLPIVTAHAQSGGNSLIQGSILDPSGAVVPGASVEFHNPVSGFDRTTVTDSAG